jgi:putative endonuclease
MNNGTASAGRDIHQTSHNRRIGEIGETAAAEHLERNGHQVLERNWRCARGEIDIITMDGGTVVFVEVKTRTSTSAGHPFDAITAAKHARLRRLMSLWLSGHPVGQHRDIRLDVVGVCLGTDGSAGIEHIKGVL